VVGVAEEEAVIAMIEERRFPVQMDSYRDALGRMQHPYGSVPWSIGAEAWEQYVRSCERIGERGGFGEGEMDEYRPGWREFLTGTNLNTSPKVDGGA
jgi:hypothetical protein